MIVRLTTVLCEVFFATLFVPLSGYSQPESGTSDLREAAANGDLESVTQWLEDGAPIDEGDASGETALVLAAAEGHLRVVRLLLTKGASLEVSGVGRSALMSASERGQLRVVKALLSSSANEGKLEVDAKDRRGKTALWFAADRGHTAVVQVLHDAGAKLDSKTHNRVTPLMTASANGELEMVEWLLSMGVKVSERDVVGATALTRAVVGGHPEVTVALIHGGADPRSRLGRLGKAKDIAKRLGHHRLVPILEKTVPVEAQNNTEADKPDAATASESVSPPASVSGDSLASWTYREDVEYGPDAFGVNELEPPRLLRQVPPEYTEDALIRRVEGQVAMEVVVLTSGYVGPLRITSNLDPGLDMAAIDAVRQWQFQPASLRGEAVNVVVDIGVDFNVRGGERLRLLRKR